MLSDRVLANFAEYLKTHPRGPASHPAGAYDSRRGVLTIDRVPRIKDFAAGGAFDSVGSMVQRVMEFCKSKGMRPDDLESLADMLNQPTEDDAGLSDEEEQRVQQLAKRRPKVATDDPPRVPMGGAAVTKAMDAARRMRAMSAADAHRGFAERYPDAANIRVLP